MPDDYRVLVTGSRDLLDRQLVQQQLFMHLGAAVMLGMRLVVVQGACPTGADAFADDWAIDRQRAGLPVAPEGHPAQGHPTEDFGPWPGAGPARNDFMVRLGARHCLAFIGPCTSWKCRRPQPHGSHGATDCANRAERAGITTRRWELWRKES